MALKLFSWPRKNKMNEVRTKDLQIPLTFIDCLQTNQSVRDQAMRYWRQHWKMFQNMEASKIETTRTIQVLFVYGSICPDFLI